MTASHLKSRLVMNSVTHVCIGLVRTGLHSNVYQLGVLFLKCDAHIDKIYSHMNDQELQGNIVLGRILNNIYKPWCVLLNRNQPSQCLIGPHRIYYEECSGDEFKFLVPTGFLNKPCPLTSQDQVTIEVFSVHASEASFKYANETSAQMNINEVAIDSPQTFNAEDFSFQNNNIDSQQLKQSLTTFTDKQVDFKILNLPIREALVNYNLIASMQNSNKNANQMTSGPLAKFANKRGPQLSQLKRPTAVAQNQVITVQKTKTQLMREQSAQSRLGSNTSQISQSPINSRSAFNNNANSTPKFNGNSNNLQRATWNQPTQQNQSFGDKSNVTMNSGNFISNNTSMQNQSGLVKQPFGQSSFAGGTQGSLQRGNFQQATSNCFESQKSNPFKQPTANPFQGQQQSSNCFKPQQPSSNCFQPQQQTQPVFQQTKTPSFSFNKPASSFQPNQPSPFGQQNQNAFQSNQQSNPFGNQNQQNSSSSVPQTAFNTQQTALPVRFGMDGSKSHAFQAKQTYPFSANSITPFQQLTIADQELLKQCLAKLAQHMSSNDIRTAESLMLNDPKRFHQLFAETENLQKQEEFKKQDDLQKEIKLKKEVKNQVNMRDLTDIQLFLLQFAEDQYAKSGQYITSNIKERILKSFYKPQTDVQSLLLQTVLSSPIPQNDNFAVMHEKLTTGKGYCSGVDMQIHLGQEKFKCHQIVFTTNSEFFKKAVRHNNDLNKLQYGEKAPVMIFYLDSWIQSDILRTYIKFMYTGQLTLIQSSRFNGLSDQLHQLFRLGCFFQDSSFQELLVAQEIVPNMNSTIAIQMVHTCLNPEPFPDSEGQRPPSSRVKAFLVDFCYLYLMKHLPVILRQDSQKILSLHKEILYKVVRESFMYVTDPKNDLEVLVEFAAKIWGQGNIFEFFRVISDRWKRCRGFDHQIIPGASDIAKVDGQEPTQLERLNGVDFQQIIRKNDRELGGLTIDSKGNLVQQQKQAQGKKALIDSIDEINVSQSSNKELDKACKPANNVFQVGENKSANTESIKNPLLTYEIDLTEKEVSEKLQKKNAITLLSRSFDACRRSWHIKVDIDPNDKTVSLFLLERGESKCNKSLLQHLQRAVPVKFSSTIVEIEVTDTALGSMKSAFFYSWAHDRHQIIGHDKFLTLDQLSDQQKFKVQVQIREDIVHSSLMHYFCNNFQRKFSEEIKFQKNQESTNRLDQRLISPCGLLSLPYYTIFQLLQSDYIKVEDENTLVQFIYSYLNERERQGNTQTASFEANLIVQALRMNFICLYYMMTGLRRNKALNQSPVFVDMVVKEFDQRLKMGKNIKLKPMNQTNEVLPEKELYFCGIKRKYFNETNIQSQGRQKLKDITDAGTHTAMALEMLQWTLKSTQSENQPSNQQDPAASNKLNQLKFELEEERNKRMKLSEDFRALQVRFNNQNGQPQLNNLNHNYNSCKPLAAVQEPLQPKRTQQSQMLNKVAFDANRIDESMTAQRRAPPAFLSRANKSINDSTIQFDSCVANGTKQAEKTGDQSNQDISAILAQLNAKRPYTPPARGNNKYLSRSKEDKENCAIQ